MLPQSKEERKQRPIATGVLDYFPDALAEVAYVSFIGNEQHNPGQRLHWDKSKSKDEADALLRHLAERGTMDADGCRHSAKVAWRALANLQREIDAEREAKTKSRKDYECLCGKPNVHVHNYACSLYNERKQAEVSGG